MAFFVFEVKGDRGEASFVTGAGFKADAPEVWGVGLRRKDLDGGGLGIKGDLERGRGGGDISDVVGSNSLEGDGLLVLKGREVDADLKWRGVACANDDGWLALGGGEDLDLVEAKVFLDLQKGGELEGNRLGVRIGKEELEFGALAIDVSGAKAGGSAIESTQDDGREGGFGGVRKCGEIHIKDVGWAFEARLCDALDIQFDGCGGEVGWSIEPFEGEFDLIAEDECALLTFFEAKSCLTVDDPYGCNGFLGDCLSCEQDLDKDLVGSVKIGGGIPLVKIGESVGLGAVEDLEQLVFFLAAKSDQKFFDFACLIRIDLNQSKACHLCFGGRLSDLDRDGVWVDERCASGGCEEKTQTQRERGEQTGVHGVPR